MLTLTCIYQWVRGRYRPIDQDFHGPIGVTKTNGTGVGFEPRFETNIFKIVVFQVFALTVFAKESLLSSILAEIFEEGLAEQQVSVTNKLIFNPISTHLFYLGRNSLSDFLSIFNPFILFRW